MPEGIPNVALYALDICVVVPADVGAVALWVVAGAAWIGVVGADDIVCRMVSVAEELSATVSSLLQVGLSLSFCEAV
jgi:hypothetical protein